MAELHASLLSCKIYETDENLLTRSKPKLQIKTNKKKKQFFTTVLMMLLGPGT